jgi:hypothetical protein
MSEGLQPYDYDELRRLASELERPVSSLIVLAPQNDPFYAGAPARHARARWSADLWTRFRLGNGIHLRRIHYRLISQSQPVPDPYGLFYEDGAEFKPTKKGIGIRPSLLRQIIEGLERAETEARVNGVLK